LHKTGYIFVAAALLIAACSSPPSATRSANYVVEGSADTGTHWRHRQKSQVTLDTEPLRSDGVHDPASESIVALQEPAEALAAFPIDRRGAPDWVKALSLGIIEPRADLEGKGEMTVLDMDILFKNTGAMPWVRFPHGAHTQWLDCTNCHDEIFIPGRGPTRLAWMPSSPANTAVAAMARCRSPYGFASAAIACRIPARRPSGGEGCSSDAMAAGVDPRRLPGGRRAA